MKYMIFGLMILVSLACGKQQENSCPSGSYWMGANKFTFSSTSDVFGITPFSGLDPKNCMHLGTYSCDQGSATVSWQIDDSSLGCDASALHTSATYSNSEDGVLFTFEDGSTVVGKAETK